MHIYFLLVAAVLLLVISIILFVGPPATLKLLGHRTGKNNNWLPTYKQYALALILLLAAVILLVRLVGNDDNSRFRETRIHVTEKTAGDLACETEAVRFP